MQTAYLVLMLNLTFDPPLPSSSTEVVMSPQIDPQFKYRWNSKSVFVLVWCNQCGH